MGEIKEIWKDILGYEGLYQVSNYGNIRSLHNYRGKYNLLKQKVKNNYYQVGLRKNNIRKWYSVHRLVAQTFIPNINNLPVINHKDENKLNNNANNLEWCTTLYNNTYGKRIEKVKNKLSKKVIQFDLLGNYINEYSSIREASIKTNISAGNIVENIKGKYKQTKGYIWKLVKEGD